MEFTLDIVIPKKAICILDIKEQLVNWGEETFSQEPPKYISSSNLVFQQVSDLNYYNKLLGDNLNAEDYIALILKSQELLDLEFIINRKKEELPFNSLLIFLAELIKLERFYIILMREDELIKNRHIVKRKEEIIDIFCNSLKWSAPKSVLIVKE